MRCLFLIPFLLLSACSSYKIEGPTGFIQIKGSDTLVNVTQNLAEEFMKKNPYIFVAVTGGGSGVGIASLINKTTDIATASRRMKKKEIEMAKKRGISPYEIIVGYDGIAIIVNKNNPVDKLTIKQLHEIYTGKITNWKELGGKDLEIVALSREVSSGTHLYFKEHIVQLGKTTKDEFASSVLMFPSNQAIVEEVASNEQAIGYIGMGYLNKRVKAVAIAEKDGDSYIYPTVEEVLAKKYPLSRPLYMYTDGKPKGIVKNFIDFVLSREGQLIFKKIGFVPLLTENAEAENN